MKKFFRSLIMCVVFGIILLGIYALYRYNHIPHRMLTGKDFNIETVTSSVDRDGDGVDDLTDMYNSVKDYLATSPQYKSKYYDSGYPDDEYGVCTDVVAQGLLGAGYDLRELMDADIKAAPGAYDISAPDKNIDFRRVVNMKVYFERHAISLTTDLSEIDQWQPGDIVVWPHHVGVISEHRNTEGVPFVWHNASAYQASYEEDVLAVIGDIVGHYRISE